MGLTKSGRSDVLRAACCLLFLATLPAYASAQVSSPYTSQNLLPDSPGTMRALPAEEAALLRPADTSFLGGVSTSAEAGPWFAEDGPSSSSDQAADPQVAKKYALTIKPGLAAQPWSAGDKLAASFIKQATLGAVFSAALSAGQGQLNDSRPHYGTDAPAFGQRFGAAFARQTSQSVFNVGVLSAVLRDDPRYYVLGPTHTFKRRVVYAATRVVITRTDHGKSTFNAPLIGAMLGSQALTSAYYPDEDRKLSRTFTGFATSLAIRLGTQQLKEFGGDIRKKILHKD